MRHIDATPDAKIVRTEGVSGPVAVIAQCWPDGTCEVYDPPAGMEVVDWLADRVRVTLLRGYRYEPY